MDELCEDTAKVRTSEGVEYWFDLPGAATVKPPPRHKMALVTIAVAFPLSAVCGWLVGFMIPDAPQLVKGLLMTTGMVLAMTYVVMPRLTRALARWLFRADA